MGEEGIQTTSIKLADLEVEADKKAMLAFCIQARDIAEFAAKFDCSYSHAYQSLSIWVAKGWLVKIDARGNGHSKYLLNSARLAL